MARYRAGSAGRAADVGVYSFPDSRKREISPSLAVRNWIDEEIVLVLPAGTPGLRDTSTISLRDLDELPRVVHYGRALGFDRTHTIEEYLKRQEVFRRYKEDWLLGVNTIAEIRDTLLRSWGLTLWTFWQNAAQLQIYGTQANTLADNAGVIQAFGARNLRMAQDLANLLEVFPRMRF